MNRRTFLATASGLALAARPAASAARLPIRKAVEASMLPQKMPLNERFQLAKDVGFEAVECGTALTQKEADDLLEASRRAKLPIHSVMNGNHWEKPLSSASPEVVGEGIKCLETSLRNAHLWGADTVLLVPAVVNPQTSYKDAWTRSQANIRKVLWLAEDLKVVIAIEEVWNKFLQSPLEMARYVDEFQSPWVRAYFDVGNVVINGYPQDWIRTLGPRIAKLHIKDFRFKHNTAEWVMLREGEIDWGEVHKALAEVGFHATATVELGGGDERYLRDVERRFEMILAGA